jgi:hypothetical protein
MLVNVIVIRLMRPIPIWPSAAHSLFRQSVRNGHLSHTATDFWSPGLRWRFLAYRLQRTMCAHCCWSPGWPLKTDWTALLVLLVWLWKCTDVCVGPPLVDLGHGPQLMKVFSQLVTHVLNVRRQLNLYTHTIQSNQLLIPQTNGSFR